MDRLITAVLLLIAAAITVLLIAALPGLSQQWIADHHCFATGEQRTESALLMVPAGPDGSVIAMPDTITYWAYLCDDRDEPHWFAVRPAA